MFLPPRQLVRLLDDRCRGPEGERLDHAVVGFLPLHLGAILPTLSTDIRLGVEYARKLIWRHSLSHGEFAVISEMIADSYCFREKAAHLTLMGYSVRYERPYTLVLKAARGGTETWVSTFHRTEHQQLRSKVRRAAAKGLVFRELRAQASEWE